MPSRSRAKIRRDINRLNESIERHKAEHPALSAVSQMVSEAVQKVNSAWQEYQASAVAGDREREERDAAIERLSKWIQRWRPVVLLSIPGAEANIRNLPAGGTTPDDVIRVVGDMARFIKENPDTRDFSQSAINDLGDGAKIAEEVTGKATDSLPAEAAARHAYTSACHDANPALIRGLEIIKAIFGRTSPEYKQLVNHSATQEDEEIATETA